jgi:ATP-dependent HslUV protease subunit HslV
VIEPDDDIVAIGSGGAYALAATRAFLQTGGNITARDIVEKGLSIAADICIYTNDHRTILEIDTESDE